MSARQQASANMGGGVVGSSPLGTPRQAAASSGTATPSARGGLVESGGAVAIARLLRRPAGCRTIASAQARRHSGEAPG